MHRYILRPALGAALLLATSIAHAQISSVPDTWWSDISERAISATGDRRIVPDTYRTVRINGTQLSDLLEGVNSGTIPEMVILAERTIALPMPDGGLEPFRFMECPVMHPDLQAQLPM